MFDAGTVRACETWPNWERRRGCVKNEFIEQAKVSGSVQQAVASAGLQGARIAPAADPTPGQEALALFDRFFLAQNAHDLGATGELLQDSPDLLWINDGVPIRGREAALQQFGAVFQGAWQLDPNMAGFQVTLLTNEVAELYAPIDITAGPAGKPALTTRVLMNQVLVKNAGGWQVASILPVPAASQ